MGVPPVNAHGQDGRATANDTTTRRADDRGVVLIIVMMIAVLLLISLAATLPSVYQEGQREKEAELIFRGTQYGRAVALFHKQFNRYPVSVKELLQTNGVRFLRQEYRDPMDPKGKWRFIHVNAQGMLLDSLNQPLTTGQNGNPAGLGTNSSTNPSAGGGFSLGGSDSMGLQSSGMGMTSSMGGSQMGSGTSASGSGFGQMGPTSSFGSPNGLQGAYIAGVAATSHHESIKVWNKHHHYDEWEFLGIDMGLLGIQVGMPGGGGGGPTGMGQQPTNQGSGFTPGFGGPNQPTSNFGPS